jgi:hypothetical protein
VFEKPEEDTPTSVTVPSILYDFFKGVGLRVVTMVREEGLDDGLGEGNGDGGSDGS